MPAQYREVADALDLWFERAEDEDQADDEDDRLAGR
jgi:hypothetical protein